MFEIIELLPKKIGPFANDPDGLAMWYIMPVSLWDAVTTYHRIRQAQPNHLPLMAELGVTFAEPSGTEPQPK